MDYYKVCIIKNNKFYSYLYDTTPNVTSQLINDSSFYIEYEFNKWVKPKYENSKLFVFDNLDIVLTYSFKYSAIFKCKVLKPITFYKSRINIFGHQHYWNSIFPEIMEKAKTEPITAFSEIDEKIILCNAVKLIERIW